MSSCYSLLNQFSLILVNFNFCKTFRMHISIARWKTLLLRWEISMAHHFAYCQFSGLISSSLRKQSFKCTRGGCPISEMSNLDSNCLSYCPGSIHFDKLLGGLHWGFFRILRSPWDVLNSR